MPTRTGESNSINSMRYECQEKCFASEIIHNRGRGETKDKHLGPGDQVKVKVIILSIIERTLSIGNRLFLCRLYLGTWWVKSISFQFQQALIYPYIWKHFKISLINNCFLQKCQLLLWGIHHSLLMSIPGQNHLTACYANWKNCKKLCSRWGMFVSPNKARTKIHQNQKTRLIIQTY